MNNHTSNKNNQAFTKVELVVVIAVTSVLASLLMAQTETPEKAAESRCRERLKLVGDALRTFAGENGGKFPPQVPAKKGGSMEYVAGGNVVRHFLTLINDLPSPVILICPADNRTPAGTENEYFKKLTDKNISYFVSLNCVMDQPSMLLAGDRNLVGSIPASDGVLRLTANQRVSWSGALHKNKGNVVCADGRVEMTTTASLQTLVKEAAGVPNILALP